MEAPRESTADSRQGDWPLGPPPTVKPKITDAERAMFAKWEAEATAERAKLADMWGRRSMPG